MNALSLLVVLVCMVLSPVRRSFCMFLRGNTLLGHFRLHFVNLVPLGRVVEGGWVIMQGHLWSYGVGEEGAYDLHPR